jgi:Mrp family chromosome partitioning ATPase
MINNQGMAADHEDDLAKETHRDQSENRGSHQIIRKGKLILYNNPPDPSLDESVVSVQRYSCFGANLFPGRNTELQLAVGVTSTRPRDGKTVVAANLATFFALDTQEDTVLVDLNTGRPRLHHVFGIPPVPGLMDSLKSDTITLSRCSIKGLWVLPCGSTGQSAMSFDRILELRETLSTLKRQFRFVVIDLPPGLQKDFPGMLSSHIDGYIVVVSAGKSTKTDVHQLLHILNESKVLGFVMNRVEQGLTG